MTCGSWRPWGRSSVSRTPRTVAASSSFPRRESSSSSGEPMDLRTLIATIGFDERHILPSLRLLPYDRLVVVGGRTSFRSVGFRRLRALEPNLEAARVDVFDLGDCLQYVAACIRDARDIVPVRTRANCR